MLVECCCRLGNADLLLPAVCDPLAAVCLQQLRQITPERLQRLAEHGGHGIIVKVDDFAVHLGGCHLS